MDMNYLERLDFDAEQEAEDALENYDRAFAAEDRRLEYGPQVTAAPSPARSIAEWRRLAEWSLAASRERRTPPQGDMRIEALMLLALTLTVLVGLYLAANWQAG